MLLRALRPFISHPDVESVVVVLPPTDVTAPPDWLQRAAGDRVLLVAGGEARAESARAGLAHLPAACTIVLIHDAARPFPDRSVIDAVISLARRGVGAIPAIPVADTLKMAREGPAGVIEIDRTIPREGLWRAQTPQGFPRTLLQHAYASSGARGLEATDDAALVERLGERVVIVPDTARNFKVTTADDFVWAEFWVSQTS